MNFNFSDILYVLVIFQLLFISLFLFTHPKGRKISNALLGAFFMAICLNLVDSFLLLKKVYFSFPELSTWSSCFPLLFGPLLYLYSQSVLYTSFRFTPKKWLHFTPFLICFLLTETAWLTTSREFKLTLMNNLLERKLPAYLYWTTSIIFLQFFVYVLASFRLINRFKKVAGDHFSDRQRMDITWLSSTILFFTICMLLSALNGFSSLTPWAGYFFLVFSIIVALIFIFINRILLKALQKPEIFALINEDESGSGRSPARYQHSTLTEGDGKKILEKLKRHMVEKRPYLEPELTLEQLATQLEVKPKLLSQVINEMQNQNFFDFINRYRIEEAKSLLAHPKDKKITVLEVLYEVGFNSKSSFNTLFKKHTGLTPSEFKKKQAE
ncbi:MAG TPA: AraC family transcriptional regulator [Puia sp.]|nr:AraC family transcriptional regulator [Puia sp.]